MKTLTKILLTFAVTIFILAFGMKDEALGQPPINCESDPCYQTQPWVSHVKPYTYGPQPACSDCWVEIHYKTRTNSPNPNCQSLPPVEYKLDFIIVSGGCYYPPCSHYPQFDMKVAFREAMTSLLSELGYAPIPPDTCGAILKDFKIVNCFREDFDADGNRIFWLCNAFTCCKQDLKLCYENGELKIKSTSKASSGDCKNDPFHPNECETICDWIDEAIVPKRALEDTHISGPNPLTVFPNPVSSGLLNFNLNGNIQIASISIVTNEGQLVQIQKDELHKGSFIDIHDYSNGYYMLVIKSSDGKNYYCQFLINK